jgi:hypothetical protein
MEEVKWMQLKKRDTNWKLRITAEAWGSFVDLSYQSGINAGTLSKCGIAWV